MLNLRLRFFMFLAAMAMHGSMMALNEPLFRQTEFLQGIGWIYLPAGTRLLCTLLFGGAGALGLLVSGWIACMLYYFPGDVLRSTMGAFAGAVGPYLVYLAASQRHGLRASLANLTPKTLLLCAVGCALASPLLHHLWFALRGDANIVSGFLVMFIGDLAGTLIVIYTAKAMLLRVPRPA
ncbi:hypothetical protein [Pseudoduganella sp.]|uniref:hypothetical protein n=1 Tax=Pseudoduganella sp. TaxID=1880898 RepID=UPI0035AEE5C0